MLKIAGVIILYHPDIKIFERINSYIGSLEKVYIIDNTEKVSSFSKDFLTEKMVYIHDGENKGIALRLNQAADLAIKGNFNWLLTMDQDSAFFPGFFPGYIYCIENYLDKDRTAMFGVQFQDKSLASTTCKAIECPHLITSGSIINLNLFSAIGRFDELLFIDKVDHEYCLRAHLHHFKIVQFENIFLNHTLGNVSYHRSLKSFEKTPRVLHSPIRMYYILRNYFYLRSKYNGQFKESFDEMKMELYNRIKNNFLYGENKLQLIKYLAKGYLDFKAGKLGKIR